MVRKIAIACVLGLAVTSASAAPNVSAPRETFKFLSAKQVGALTDKPGAGPQTAHLAEHPGYDVEYAQRSDTGNQAEVHAHKTHYINILEGQGTLTYGGSVTAPKQTAPGEIRGSTIVGGTVIAVHAGDYVQIPAGTPHLFNPASGTRLRYIVFNIMT